MDMMLPILITYILLLLTGLLLIPFLKTNRKGIVTVAVVTISAILSGILAVEVLKGSSLEMILPGSYITGDIPVRLDALSGWFILIINFTFITAAFYGLQYMKAYHEQKSNITLHCIAFLLAQSMITIVCMVQNAIVFLVALETMALSVTVLVIFEHYRNGTIKAGLNYIIQSHLTIVFVSIGFIWVASRLNSFDFNAITQFTMSHPPLVGVALFLCFFMGFAFKAGFVPFHTWLPYAHPAAPAHVSGLMSGVVIKIGIYGILRVLLLVKADYTMIGFIILFISVISGVYGVMLAIIQHNLKKLLAYHSVENIGIIGIGIGLGTIGIGTQNYVLTVVGFAGGLLHVLNHSLFKSLLFFGAGNVYQATHTVNVEKLGGLVKRMPHTSILFLAAALAICGLPPFNGFVSEFLIYTGLFNGIMKGNLFPILSILFSIFGLVLIGGLALLCFTKAFGAVFLGNTRDRSIHQVNEANTGKLIPMYMIMGLIVAIGLFPGTFLQLMAGPVKLFTDKLDPAMGVVNPFLSITGTMQWISWCAAGFMILSGAIFFIRKSIAASKPVDYSSTWGCGYVGDTRRMQYSASSFVRTYRKLAEPVFSLHKKKKDIRGIFPKKGWHEIHPYDKIEYWVVDVPLRQMKYIFGKLSFLQNGNPQYYLLYGIGFITLVIGTPFLFDALKLLVKFLNQL